MASGWGIFPTRLLFPTFPTAPTALGADGKTYPAPRPRPKPARVRRRL
jgi:hypothetical protein